MKVIERNQPLRIFYTILKGFTYSLLFPNKKTLGKEKQHFTLQMKYVVPFWMGGEECWSKSKYYLIALLLEFFLATEYMTNRSEFSILLTHLTNFNSNFRFLEFYNINLRLYSCSIKFNSVMKKSCAYLE